ncbi:MAG: hypothetical protein HN348_35300, partial [Proteobacteria bacterium]|nr:hypothetical protein [Pseudomonadota bacterium]
MRVPLISLFSLLVSPLAWGADLNVGPQETYTTIKAALTQAQDGDRIIVAAGTYTDSLIIFQKEIEIVGADYQTTFISTGSGENVVDIYDSTVVLSNLSIDGASERRPMQIQYNSAVQLLNMALFGGPDNSSNDGGSLLIESNSVVSLDNAHLVTATDARRGGQIAAFDSDLSLVDSFVSQGDASEYGGGIYAIDSILSLENTTVDNNYGYEGGGLFVSYDYLSPATLYVDQSGFAQNDAYMDAADIYGSTGNVTILSSDF